MHDPNEFFDVALYLQKQDIHKEYPHPLFHYLEIAGNHEVNPSERFNVVGYLQMDTEMANAGINPLEHYLRYGRFEGRSPKPLVVVYDEDRLRLKDFGNTPTGKRLVLYTAIAGD